MDMEAAEGMGAVESPRGRQSGVLGETWVGHYHRRRGGRIADGPGLANGNWESSKIGFEARGLCDGGGFPERKNRDTSLKSVESDQSAESDCR